MSLKSRLPSFIVALGLLLLGGSVSSAIVIDTVGDVKIAIREATGIESTSLLPDSTILDIAKRALLWTSVDVGGIELQYKFSTVAGQAFYAIPDSITEVLYASLLSGDITKSIKAWYPQFAEDHFQLSQLPTYETSEDDIPAAYNYWADTIQLIPAPQKVDSIYLKCFVEHPDGAVGDSVHLKPAYTEAAILYGCHLALLSVMKYEEAATFLSLYDKKKEALRQRYTRKFDLFKNE